MLFKVREVRVLETEPLAGRARAVMTVGLWGKENERKGIKKREI